ncbi:MAG: sialidase family protein [Vicinamibacterales bacterium]
MRRIVVALSGIAALGLVAAASSPIPTVALRAAADEPQLFSSPVRQFASSPAPEGSAEPRLTVARNGRVLLSWLAPVSAPAAVAGQKPGTGYAFQFSELTGERWSSPRTITEGPALLANWADFPSLFVTRNDVLAAHWLERRGQSRTAYDVKLRTSRDGGRTWTSEATPHRDGTETEHGFVSFFETPGKGHGLGMVWLDGREMAGHGAHGEGGGQMTLRSAMVSAQGMVGAEAVVDPRVCDCCQTAAATTDTGVLIAYRDRSDKEVRDIYVSRFENGQWSAGSRVHEDNWEINGCPVNGPAIAAKGQRVAVAWFVAKDNAPKTQLAFSKDGGRSFGRPVRIDSGTTLGRVGLTLLADGRALVSWIDGTGATAKFMVRDVSSDGTMGAPVTVGPIGSERTSGFPQVALSGRKVVVAWTNVVKGAPTGIFLAAATLSR